MIEEPTLGELAVELRGRLKQQDDTLGEIKEQVTRTNGRVTALETKNAVAAALAERGQQVKIRTLGHYRWIFETVVALAATAALVIEAVHFL